MDQAAIIAGARAATHFSVEALAPKLAALAESYRAARETASNAARYTSSSAPPRTCRYCGQSWSGSPTNDGHARCIVTPEFERSVAELWWSSPKLTREAIARALGVSNGTVHAWTNPRRMLEAQCG